MRKQRALKDIIFETDLWRRIDGGYAPFGYTAGPTAAYSALYFEEDFYAIDPRLPIVLAEMANQFNGRWLTIPLAYWAQPEIYLPSPPARDGETTDPLRVRYLRNFEPEHATGRVIVEFTAYEMRSSVTGLRFPTGHIPHKSAYLREVVDACIPQWEERFAVAATLDLDETEMTAYIFNTSAQVSVYDTPILPEFSFE